MSKNIYFALIAGLSLYLLASCSITATGSPTPAPTATPVPTPAPSVLANTWQLTAISSVDSTGYNFFYTFSSNSAGTATLKYFGTTVGSCSYTVSGSNITITGGTAVNLQNLTYVMAISGKTMTWTYQGTLLYTFVTQ